MLIGIRVTVFALLLSAIALLGRPASVEAREVESGTCYRCLGGTTCVGGYMLGGYTCLSACGGNFDCAIT